MTMESELRSLNSKCDSLHVVIERLVDSESDMRKTIIALQEETKRLRAEIATLGGLDVEEPKDPTVAELRKPFSEWPINPLPPENEDPLDIFCKRLGEIVERNSKPGEPIIAEAAPPGVSEGKQEAQSINKEWEVFVSGEASLRLSEALATSSRLSAENERLEKELEDVCHSTEEWTPYTAEAMLKALEGDVFQENIRLTKEIATLRATAAEVEKDVERIDYLERWHAHETHVNRERQRGPAGAGGWASDWPGGGGPGSGGYGRLTRRTIPIEFSYDENAGDIRTQLDAYSRKWKWCVE